MTYMEAIGRQAKNAVKRVQLLGQDEKNRGLRSVAELLRAQSNYILKENQKDIVRAEEQKMKESLIDRLRLSKERIEAMAEGLYQIADLEDPVGEVISMK